jgi:hypothetical protein
MTQHRCESWCVGDVWQQVGTTRPPGGTLRDRLLCPSMAWGAMSIRLISVKGHIPSPLAVQVLLGQAHGPQGGLREPPAGMFFSCARRARPRRAALSTWLFLSRLDIHDNPNLDGLLRGNP